MRGYTDDLTKFIADTMAKINRLVAEKMALVVPELAIVGLPFDPAMSILVALAAKRRSPLDFPSSFPREVGSANGATKRTATSLCFGRTRPDRQPARIRGRTVTLNVKCADFQQITRSHTGVACAATKTELEQISLRCSS